MKAFLIFELKEQKSEHILQNQKFILSLNTNDLAIFFCTTYGIMDQYIGSIINNYYCSRRTILLDSPRSRSN